MIKNFRIKKNRYFLGSSSEVLIEGEKNLNPAADDDKKDWQMKKLTARTAAEKS